MTIVTSDFASPGTYYGQATVIGNSSVEVKFVVEVRRNDGIRFYFEEDDDIVAVKAFEDEDLVWKLTSGVYTTNTLNLGNKKLKIKYFTVGKIFEISWSLTTPVTGTNGDTGKRYPFYLKDASDLSAPRNAPSETQSISMFKVIFFIIAAIIAIAAAAFAGVYVNRYLFFR